MFLMNRNIPKEVQIELMAQMNNKVMTSYAKKTEESQKSKNNAAKKMINAIDQALENNTAQK